VGERRQAAKNGATLRKDGSIGTSEGKYKSHRLLVFGPMTGSLNLSKQGGEKKNIKSASYDRKFRVQVAWQEKKVIHADGNWIRKDHVEMCDFFQRPIRRR